MIKTINRWEIFRISLLATTSTAVLFVLLKSLISPNFVDTKITNLDLPETVLLKEWQQVALINNKTSKFTEEVSRRHYRYIQNSVPLDIEMHYLSSTDGNVLKLVKKYNQLGAAQLSVDVRQQPGIGYYGLFTHEKKASLSACINPSRQSTFKAEQFVQNQLTPDVLSKRFLPWLFSGKSLRDRRCLLVKLSIPLENTSHQNAYITLEKVWINWYQWWQPRLPS